MTAGGRPDQAGFTPEAREQFVRLVWNLVDADLADRAAGGYPVRRPRTGHVLDHVVEDARAGGWEFVEVVLAFVVPLAGEAVSRLAALRGETPGAVLDEVVQAVEWGPDES